MTSVGPAARRASVGTARGRANAVGLAVSLCLVAAWPTPGAASGLAGDWGGVRTRLAERGVALRAEVTGFATGLLEGTGESGADGLGRWDAHADVDFGKLGLAEGLSLNVHAEGRVGTAPFSYGGQLWPANTGAVVPLGGRSAAATSIHLRMPLGERSTLLLGKINALDLLAADPVLGGLGTRRFAHLAFAAPPSGVVPPTIMGGVLVRRGAPWSWTTMVFDPGDRTRNYGFGGLFSTGVNLGVTGTWSGDVSGRRSSLSLNATGSTRRGADLGDLLAPPGFVTEPRKGSFNLSAQFAHRLPGGDGRKDQGLDLAVKVAIADGNPNPIRSALLLGLVGRGLVAGRPGDEFGLGGFFYDLSDVLQDTIAPLLDVDDEAGLEAWYGIALGPDARLSAHLQLVDPARGASEVAWIGGLRLNLRL